MQTARIATLVFGWLVGIGILTLVVWTMKRDIARDEREAARDTREVKRDERELARDHRESDLVDAGVPHHGAMAAEAQTNAFRASVTATNLSPNEVRYGCLIGVVTHKKTQLTAKSVEVCTGPVHPHSSVTIEAPYAPGAIEHLCNDPERGFTWDVCQFEMLRTDD